MEKYMVYVNFESRTIGFSKNVLDWTVGEITKRNGQEMMIYANFNLNYYGLKTLKYIFKRGLKKFDNFCDKINYAVEEIIELTKNDDFGKALLEYEENSIVNEIERMIKAFEL